MRRTILFSVAVFLLAGPAFAAPYPVQGSWGESKTPQQGAIDCRNLHVIAFNGEERTDNKGGVPGFRNVSVTAEGTAFRVVDVFTTGQVRNGRVYYTLRKLDDDHIELDMRPGGKLKLQRCK